MTYTLVFNSSMIIRDSDGTAIPPDPRNADWQGYQAWIAAGNMPTPAPIPPAPIPSCALWQLQAAMTAAQWTQVTAAVAALNNSDVSAFFAHGTNIIPANSTTLLAIGATIGMTAAQVASLVADGAAIAIP
jgi:hypothetical protein